MSAKIVIAHHPYEASRDDEISFEKEEIIKVTDDTDPDWWVGKKKDGSLGFFPSNFVTVKEDNEPTSQKPTIDNDQVKEEPKVDIVSATEEAEPVKPEKTVEETPITEEKKVDQVIGMARVMEDYAMQEPGELTLPRGGIINIYEIIDDEWSRGELNGKVGRYPSKYVEDIDMPGRPDLGRQQSAGSADAQKSPLSDEDGSAPKGGFKLAAFGVKQGGIGSLLAGGFPGLKKTGAAKPENKPAPTEEKKQASPVEPAAESPISPASGVPLVPAFTATEQEPETASAAPPATEKPLGKAIVLHPYDADNEDELSLLRGEYVEIFDKNADDGWWRGKNERGESGVFPSNFVKELEEDVIAPPTPTRARRSVNSTSSSSTTENRPPSINSMARPPQVPRPSSVQTPGTTKPVTLNPRPSTINAPVSNAPTMAIPPRPAAAQSPVHAASPSIPESVEEAIKEEEQYEADEEKPTGSEMTSPVRSEVEESPLFVPKVAERSIVTPTEEAAPSPPVVQEDPITDEEEKESGVDEEPISREISSSQEPEVEITQEPTITKIKEPVEEPKVREPVIEKPRVEEPKVEEPKIEEPKIEEPKTEEPIVEEPKVEEPKIEEPMVEESTSEPTVGAKDSDKDEPNTSTREIKQEEQASIVVQEESEDEFKDAAEQSASIVSEQKPIVTEKEEEPIAKKEEEPEVPVVVEEEKKEFDIIPTGPKLTAPTRVRIGAGRARRSPQASQEPSQMEVLQKELESAPEEEVKKPVIPEKPASPPAKPIKPIFAKFPTPFAVGAEEISKRNLKPTQTRRLWDEKPAEESQPATTTAASTDEEPVRPSGVKNIASRFNFNGGGSGSNEVLETKLKNHTKNEVEKVRKEFEQLLQEEREKRINLEKIVQELLEKVEALGGNN